MPKPASIVLPESRCTFAPATSARAFRQRARASTIPHAISISPCGRNPTEGVGRARPSHLSIESKIATTGGFGSDDAIGLQMTRNDYVFITRWRIAARCEEIADIFEPGTEHGLGRVVDVVSKDFLPYTTRWRFTVIEEAYHHWAMAQGRKGLRRELARRRTLSRITRASSRFF